MLDLPAAAAAVETTTEDETQGVLAAPGIPPPGNQPMGNERPGGGHGGDQELGNRQEQGPLQEGLEG
jgi:hypothetical protein